MRVDECTEYVGFQDVACCKCGALASVRVDAWMLAVRTEVVLKVGLSPSFFECVNCHTVNRMRVEFDTQLVAEKQEDAQPSPAKILRWHGTGDQTAT